MADQIIVYAPIKLTSSELKRISDFMGKEHNIKASAVSKVDKSVIAGFRIEYKDLELDYSIKGKLQRLAKELT